MRSDQMGTKVMDIQGTESCPMNRNAFPITETRDMDEDQLMKEVLHKFINCPEQTYEEFLSIFTHVLKEMVYVVNIVHKDIY